MSRTLLAVALLIASPIAAQHGQHGGAQHGHSVAMAAPAPEAIIVPAAGTTLPMREINGRAVVQIRINGKGPFPFVLGSAATLTVIDSALSNELQLPVAEGVQAAPTGGTTPSIVQIQEVRVGEAAVRGFIAAAMPLRDLLGPEPGAPRGILAAGVFQAHLVTFDFPANRVSITRGKIESADKLATFEYSESRPMLPVRLGGREIRVALDTASGHGLTLPLRWMNDVPLAAPAKPDGSRRTTAGEFPVSTASLNDAAEIGQFKLAAREISFSDARSGSGPPTGSIGNGALRGFIVTLDPWNHRIRLSQ